MPADFKRVKDIFLAAVEHTNYMPASDYSGLHVLYLGNYLPMDHPL